MNKAIDRLSEEGDYRSNDWGVNQGDVNDAQDKLDGQFNGEKKLETVVCPHCGEEFTYG